MSGDALTAKELERVREALAHVPFARLLGIEIESITRGAATLSLELRPDMTQNAGLMHGGAIASLLDTAAAFAVRTLVAPEEQTVTVDLTIHYLRPVTSGKLSAEARVLRAGRRLQTIFVEAHDQAQTLVATAITTYSKTR